MVKREGTEKSVVWEQKKVSQYREQFVSRPGGWNNGLLVGCKEDPRAGIQRPSSCRPESTGMAEDVMLRVYTVLGRLGSYGSGQSKNVACSTSL